MAQVTRSKIIRADQANYDGVDLTTQRVDATGSSVTGLVVGDHVDVLQVFGDGDQYTISTILAALNYIGSNVATLKFAPGTWVIDANITIPATLANIISGGAVFAIATGITLTFSGPVHVEYSAADGTGWYTLTGSGAISCSVGATGQPGW
jgi:hypothetical protein